VLDLSRDPLLGPVMIDVVRIQQCEEHVDVE
jgi:hypothetical protein